jgi:hypothetical protein
MSRGRRFEPDQPTDRRTIIRACQPCLRACRVVGGVTRPNLAPFSPHQAENALLASVGAAAANVLRPHREHGRSLVTPVRVEHITATGILSDHGSGKPAALLTAASQARSLSIDGEGRR